MIEAATLNVQEIAPVPVAEVKSGGETYDTWGGGILRGLPIIQQRAAVLGKIYMPFGDIGLEKEQVISEIPKHSFMLNNGLIVGFEMGGHSAISAIYNVQDETERGKRNVILKFLETGAVRLRNEYGRNNYSAEFTQIPSSRQIDILTDITFGGSLLHMDFTDPELDIVWKDQFNKPISRNLFHPERRDVHRFIGEAKRFDYANRAVREAAQQALIEAEHILATSGGLEVGVDGMVESGRMPVLGTLEVDGEELFYAVIPPLGSKFGDKQGPAYPGADQFELQFIAQDGELRGEGRVVWLTEESHRAITDKIEAKKIALALQEFGDLEAVLPLVTGHDDETALKVVQRAIVETQIRKITGNHEFGLKLSDLELVS